MIQVRFLPYKEDMRAIRSVAATCLGNIAAEVREDGAIVRLTLDAEPLAGDVSEYEPLIQRIIDALADRERTVEFDVAPDCGALQLDTLRAISSIPRLSLATYSDVARMAGRERAVRAVATMVGKNPLPLLIPCHRVVPVAVRRNLPEALANPRMLGNYTPNPALKARILRMEGYFDDENAAIVKFLL